MELHVLPFIVFSVVIAMFLGLLSVKLYLESAHGEIRAPPGAELRKVISLSVDRGGAVSYTHLTLPTSSTV